MNNHLYQRVLNAWKEMAHYQTPEPLERELEFYKKMLGIFQIGDYFYVIFNIAEATVDFCDKGIIKVLGYDPHQLSSMQFLENIHPEDLPIFMNYGEAVADFYSKLPPEKVLRYKARYDYRVRCLNGTYKRLMMQAIPIQSDQSGAILRTLIVYTDIEFLKKDKSITLSLLDMDGETSYPNFKSTQSQPLLQNPLSKRELEVLDLLGRGKPSKEIAKELFLSTHTVNNHRKNMLRKAGVHSSAELLGKALANTWI